MKRIAAVLAALTLLITWIPAGVIAVAGTQGAFTYTVENGAAAITAVDTAVSGDVVVPDTLGGYPVTAIAEEAFRGCANMTAVTVPATVTHMEREAFAGCTALTAVNICDLAAWCGITFDGTFVTVSDWDPAVERYYQDATANPLYYAKHLYVSGVEVTDLVIPKTVTHVSDFAFCNMENLVSLTVHEAVSGIGLMAFAGCTSLASLDWYAVDCDVAWGYEYEYGELGYGWTYVTDERYPFADAPITTAVFRAGVRTVPAYLLSQVKTLREVRIAGSVEHIGANAFDGCTALSAVHVADTDAWCAVYFENAAANPLVHTGNLFSGDNLVRELHVSDGVRRVAAEAFIGCENITVITLPDSVKSIGSNAFYGTGYYNDAANWTNGELYIGRHLIRAAAPADGVYVVPSSVSAIDAGAFADLSGITAIHVSDVSLWCEMNFPSASANPLANNGALYVNGTLLAGDLVLPSGIVAVGDYAFQGFSQLTSLTVPQGTCAIGQNAFSGTGLTFAVLPDSVERIGEAAFASCTALEAVDLPQHLAVLANNLFKNCTALETVVFPQTAERIGYHAFYGCAALTSLEIPYGVTFIGLEAFCQCSAVTKVFLPSTLAYVERRAFASCIRNQAVYYSGNAEEAAQIAYHDGNTRVTGATWYYDVCEQHVYATACDPVCTVCGYTRGNTHFFVGENPCLCVRCGYDSRIQYYTYTIANGTATITDVDPAIAGEIVIPAMLGGCPVTAIGAKAFQGCDKITALTIPDGVTTIGDSGFRSCTGLLEVTIPASVMTIGNYAFKDCTALETVHFLATACAAMGASAYPAFHGCTALTTLYIGDGVQSIPAQAFRGITSLTTVYLSHTVKTINKNAFYQDTALVDVYYDGTETDRTWISVASYNTPLTNATWHYATASGCFHTTVTVEKVVAPTCTAAGYTGDTVCVDCGAVVATGVVMPAVGHIFGDDNLCDGCGQDQNIGYYTYTIENGAVTLTDVDTAVKGHVALPSTIDGYPVVAIGDNALRNCRSMTALTIPSSVTTIGNYAFKDCTALETVYYNAANCTAAGVNAYPVFHGCSALGTVYIGKGVEAIPPRLFRSAANLTKVYLTKNTKVIGAHAFYLCDNLATVYYVGTASDYIAVDIKSYNTALLGAGWFYNMPCFDQHDWTADCDNLCDMCGEKRSTTHQAVVDDAAVAPTCTASGLTAGSHCTACGNVMEKQMLVPAVGHVWDSGTVLVAPTTSSTGKKRYTCTVCGETKTVVTTPAEIRNGYYYYNGVLKPGAGLQQVEDAYYFVTSTGAVKTGRYAVTNTGDSGLEKGIYYFFADGKMNLERGVYDNYYYNDQGKSEAYAGLIEWNGSKYYVNDGGMVKTGRYFVTKLNGLVPRKWPYTFYPDGRMLTETLIYHADGYYYENGMRVPYAGLVESEGHLYYVADHGAYVTDKMQIVVNVNNTGKVKNGRYWFDENGHMLYNVIRNGRYFGADGLAPSYAGVVEADGSFYYVGGTHGALTVNKTFTVSATKSNGLIPSGKYTADATGKLTPAA